MALMDSKFWEIWCVPGCKKCQQENERREKSRKRLLEKFIKAGEDHKKKLKVDSGNKDNEPLTPKKPKKPVKDAGKGQKHIKK